jgi:hypothetical protein
MLSSRHSLTSSAAILLLASVANRLASPPYGYMKALPGRPDPWTPEPLKRGTFSQEPPLSSIKPFADSQTYCHSTTQHNHHGSCGWKHDTTSPWKCNNDTGMRRPLLPTKRLWSISHSRLLLVDPTSRHLALPLPVEAPRAYPGTRATLPALLPR